MPIFRTQHSTVIHSANVIEALVSHSSSSFDLPNRMRFDILRQQPDLPFVWWYCIASHYEPHRQTPSIYPPVHSRLEATHHRLTPSLRAPPENSPTGGRIHYGFVHPTHQTLDITSPTDGPNRQPSNASSQQALLSCHNRPVALTHLQSRLLALAGHADQNMEVDDAVPCLCTHSAVASDPMPGYPFACRGCYRSCSPSGSWPVCPATLEYSERMLALSVPSVGREGRVLTFPLPVPLMSYNPRHGIVGACAHGNLGPYEHKAILDLSDSLGLSGMYFSCGPGLFRAPDLKVHGTTQVGALHISNISVLHVICIVTHGLAASGARKEYHCLDSFGKQKRPSLPSKDTNWPFYLHITFNTNPLLLLIFTTKPHRD
ncbi:hypothetical protein ACRALDRAFT_209476 [Sodiomyces alcalophilus JCM 7366]|uniref:uncharacterized protein n=1 Tax=Sodiomyces alcalophilus JCM 7366 TaxID=591952 RepID=UPI0039B38460